MKRKIAILLAAVMTTAVVPMNVLASSSNQPSRQVNVVIDEILEDVYLKITPNDKIVTGDSIAITIENGEFLESNKTYTYNTKQYKFSDYQYSGVTGEGKSVDWNGASATWERVYKTNAEGSTASQAWELAEDNFFSTNSSNAGVDPQSPLYKSPKLPYNLKSNGTKEIQVSLFPIDKYVGSKSNDGTENKYHYNIELPIKATSTGEIKIKIDSNETSITGGGSYPIATVSTKSGSTRVEVDEVRKFEDVGNIKDITIKENVKDTFKTGDTVKLRLSGSFNFKRGSKITIAPGINANFPEFTVDVTKEDSDIEFKMPDVGDRSKAAAIKITGVKIVADDDEDDWGNVNLTVSGAGLTRETIKIAERQEFNFKLTALEEPTTIYAGRFHQGTGEGENGSDKSTVAQKELEEDDFVTAEVKFEEAVVNTWFTDRKLEFVVPEGIKIYGYEIDELEEINGYDEEDGSGNIDGEYFFDEDGGKDEFVSLTNDGRNLKIEKGIDLVTDRSDGASFKLKLYISADADYSGEVALTAKGAGIAEGEIDEVVIANVVTPIKVETTSTKTNMGYQAVSTADIVITEAEEGILLKNGMVYVDLDASFGTSEVGFADEGIVVDTDGQVEVTNVKINDGRISFKVDKASYNAPGTIRIKNVKVGATRSVPYGNYDLKVYGNAIINNYDEDKEADDVPGFFDTTEAYGFKDYYVITTVTGTLDQVVKVTIGERTILVDDKAYDMDVAPYIQASSNSTMVPLRFVSVALGVDVDSVENPDASSKISYDANTKTATIYYGSGTGQKIIQFQAGSNIMKVDGNQVPMEYGVVAEITDSRMFVPFRALGQALGVAVDWDADTRTATYNQK